MAAETQTSIKGLAAVLSLLTAVLTACVTGGNEKTPVVLTQENAASVLNGEWTGRLESYGVGLVWGGSVSLTIDASERRGSFTLEGVPSWDSALEISNGKARLRISYGTREFSVYQTTNGLIMEANYASTWQGLPRNNYLRLRKK